MTSPIYNDDSALSGLIGTAVQEVVRQAKALGISWTIRPATVSLATRGITSVIMDGDTSPIGVSNISNSSLLSGQRVYVLITPPSGNFVIGAVDDPVILGNACGTVQSMASGSTTSLSYISQPGSPNVTVTKKFDDTYLRFSWAQTYYTSAGVNALFSVLTAAGNVVFLGKHNLANGATNSHTPISSVAGAAGIPAGTQTWVGAWATAGGGAGSLVVDGGDFWSLCIEEYWPSD